MRTISVKDLERELAAWQRESASALRDEAPRAYKDIGAVMRAQRDLVRITRRLRPVLAFQGGRSRRRWRLTALAAPPAATPCIHAPPGLPASKRRRYTVGLESPGADRSPNGLSGALRCRDGIGKTGAGRGI